MERRQVSGTRGVNLVSGQEKNTERHSLLATSIDDVELVGSFL